MLDLLLLLVLLAGAVWLDGLIRRHTETPGVDASGRGAISPKVDEYLDRVDAGLDLPARDRAEIRNELLMHLLDSTAAIEAEGLEEEHAQREALARLGNPAELAKAMNEAHHSTRRLLAGAAGGVFEAGVGAVAGTVIGWIAAILGMLIATLLLGTVLRPLTDSIAGILPNFESGQDAVGLNTALVAGVSAFAAWMAARRAVRTSHRLSRWSIGTVGRWWALVGGGFLAFLLLFVVRAQQTWLTVPIEMAIPVAFAAGAVLGVGRNLSLRVPAPLIAVGVVSAFVLPVALLAASGTSGASSGGYSYNTDQQSMAFDRVAPAWAGNGFGEGVAVDSSSGHAASLIDMTVTFDDPAILASFTDLRFEAWRSVHYPEAPAIAQEAMVPDLAYATPYQVQEADVQSGAASMRMDLGRARTTSWLVFLTGVGPDGMRYRLTWPQPFISTFDGTVWDFLQAGN